MRRLSGWQCSPQSGCGPWTSRGVVATKETSMEHLLFHPVGFIAALALIEGNKELSFNPAVLIASLYVFALAAFLGYQVISRVPPLLHTPLMSATNAISGISLVGSIVIAGSGHGTVATVLGFVAVVCSTTNVVGGFVITDRMLRMFKRKK